jgi:methyltransferase family protein
MVISRHQFLGMLHDSLQPRGYLEIGVQFGDSLRLARCPAIGIDPEPHLQGHFPGTTQVARTTSDNYFEAGPPALEYIDLAFIDGMHLFEYALRDFMNMELYSNPRTVVVFDDVLPRNQHEAARAQCPGDWTGDVWKVPKLLEAYRRDLKLYWVNTEPTGTCVVYGFKPGQINPNVAEQVKGLGLEAWEAVPDDVITRIMAVEPAEALDNISMYLSELETQES